MKSTLFVYGTLLLNIESDIANFLKSNAEFVGEGYLFGQLFDLGYYPGAIFRKDISSQVYGHVFELNQPSSTLPILDEYEAVGEQFGQYKEYVREKVPIEIEGEEILCWVYLYALPTDDFPLIGSGNYRDFLKNSPKHQEFIKSV
ncbi:MAG: gamma-glutamylcyclotransferase (GGCT)/AIG2-like uncharacterized protein YtfP [Paraglaciecola sp.]|jgi:gamma-glutamylcyclotransferase (GGCT)/AIG2-like uncharacterized protein YtfP